MRCQKSSVDGAHDHFPPQTGHFSRSCANAPHILGLPFACLDMALLSLQNVSIAFGGHNILQQLTLNIEKNQRICLLGRNGTGKTTLMKIIDGQLAPDSGLVQKEQNVKVSYFSQHIPQELTGSAFDIIAKGLGQRGELLLKYHHEERRLAQEHDVDHEQLNRLHDELETHHSWSAFEEIERITSRLALQSDWEYRALSGGQKRRVLLAAALVSEPDLLLLDEPTNHLDITTITWLEEFLPKLGATLLFVTHDRRFLKKLATRIIELDRGELIDWSCDYETFLERKQAVLDDQEKAWEKFDKKLAQEEVWIRRGIKARRTRNEGRVQALLKMREERRKRRLREGAVTLKMQEAQRSGKIVIEAHGVTYRYNDTPLIENLHTLITAGDKIGIIGPNGCGKTTLINLLLGNLTPQAGTIRRGTNLAITYFDQLREQLDEAKTVWENVLPAGDYVSINGRNTHIISYLQDFLFTPERAKTPISQLSGGERNRLLLARLFTKPANLLVLDEPTNDLDAETLELLEELLVNFQGTVLLICHDREFLNNVVTSTLVFGDNGALEEYVGGYDDWLAQKPAATPPVKASAPAFDKKKLSKEELKTKPKRKLSFSEQREIQALPTQIEALEQEQSTLHANMADPAFYRQPKEAVAAAVNRLTELAAEITHAYARWEYLEALESPR